MQPRAGARGYAQDVVGDEGVAEEALKRGPGRRQARADQKAGHEAGKADLEEHRFEGGLQVRLTGRKGETRIRTIWAGPILSCPSIRETVETATSRSRSRRSSLPWSIPILFSRSVIVGNHLLPGALKAVPKAPLSRSCAWASLRSKDMHSS